MAETESSLETLLTEGQDLLVDYWIDRMIDHPDSNFNRSHVNELDTVCRQGLKACHALLQDEPEPNLKQFVKDLLDKREEWELEAADILRFFWELRTAVEESLSRGENPGRPDWRTLHEDLDRCIEVGVFNLVQFVENP